MEQQNPESTQPSSPEVQPQINVLDHNHKYVFKSGEYGTYTQYWYQDSAGNYWRYSNAPEGHPDHDPYGGAPTLDPEQAFQHSDVAFFTPDGLRRHMASPEGVIVLDNPGYDPSKLERCWYEYYMSQSGGIKYIYLDKDVKENLDLYVQHQIRVADAGVVRYRQFAGTLFQGQHPKDKVVGCIMFLVDQAYYTVDELIGAKVADLSFIDETVQLLGRKFKCDTPLLDFLTSLVVGRLLTDPLFSIDSRHSTNEPIGPNTIYSVFAYQRVSPLFLKYWHANHLFSKVINKLALFKVPPEEVEDRAYVELGNIFNTSKDVKFYVDYQVKNTLLNKYEEFVAAGQQNVTKSLLIERSDDYGVAQVQSDLMDRKPDELEFSQWLHEQPLHSEFEGSTAILEEKMAQEVQAQNADQENTIQTDDPMEEDNPVEDAGPEV